MTSPDWLHDPETPYLLIDEARYRNNIHRLYSHIEGLGSHVRPHLKTLRSAEAAAYLLKMRIRLPLFQPWPRRKVLRRPDILIYSML